MGLWCKYLVYTRYFLFIYLLKHINIYPGWPITQGVPPWRPAPRRNTLCNWPFKSPSSLWGHSVHFRPCISTLKILNIHHQHLTEHVAPFCALCNLTGGIGLATKSSGIFWKRKTFTGGYIPLFQIVTRAEIYTCCGSDPRLISTVRKMEWSGKERSQTWTKDSWSINTEAMVSARNIIERTYISSGTNT